MRYKVNYGLSCRKQKEKSIGKFSGGGYCQSELTRGLTAVPYGYGKKGGAVNG